mmetsp:Transcript_27378/g.84468  ORF Transcript_27378/g.84468 Transcript_27378/m.84468 type:complete len:279 (-) Transcript_27378:372-1208(-)
MTSPSNTKAQRPRTPPRCAVVRSPQPNPMCNRNGVSASSSTTACIASAHAAANAAASATVFNTGAMSPPPQFARSHRPQASPQIHSTVSASPLNWTMSPPWSWTMSIKTPKNAFKVDVSRSTPSLSAPICSARFVKPDASAKSTAPVRFATRVAVCSATSARTIPGTNDLRSRIVRATAASSSRLNLCATARCAPNTTSERPNASGVAFASRFCVLARRSVELRVEPADDRRASTADDRRRSRRPEADDPSDGKRGRAPGSVAEASPVVTVVSVLSDS